MTTEQKLIGQMREAIRHLLHEQQEGYLADHYIEERLQAIVDMKLDDEAVCGNVECKWHDPAYKGNCPVTAEWAGTDIVPIPIQECPKFVAEQVEDTPTTSDEGPTQIPTEYRSIEDEVLKESVALIAEARRQERSEIYKLKARVAELEKQLSDWVAQRTVNPADIDHDAHALQHNAFRGDLERLKTAIESMNARWSEADKDIDKRFSILNQSQYDMAEGINETNKKLELLRERLHGKDGE